MTIEDVLATQSRADIAKWLERGLRVQLHEQMQKGYDMRKPGDRMEVARLVWEQKQYWQVTPEKVYDSPTEAYERGVRDERSRSQSRPGDGDMGG